MARRYEMRKEPNGLRSIIDVVTGHPATLEGVLMVGLTVHEADDMLYILKSKDLSDRRTKGSTLSLRKPKSSLANQRRQPNRLKPVIRTSSFVRFRQFSCEVRAYIGQERPAGGLSTILR